MRKRKVLIQTNAAVLHRLTKSMRPKWRKELEALKLNPQNNTVEFTDSMQEEIKEAVEQKLLSGPPKEDTIDELAQEVYQLVERREKNNKSVGHVLLGVAPPRDPLIHGTVHIGPDGQLGRYHLKYWPQEDTELRELNGTMNVSHLKVDVSHKSAGSKLLQSILTIKPKELSHNEADRVLGQIFTKPTIKTIPSVKVTAGTVRKETIVSTTIRSPTEKPAEADLSQNAKNGFKELDSIEYKKQIKGTTETDYEKSTLKYFMIETTTNEPAIPTKFASFNYFMTHLPSIDLAAEFKKLRETISKSRNVSATLMEEMEACERLKNKVDLEQSIKAKSEDNVTPFGSWKLQQRIKEFRPQKPFPSMAPFVRRWPTFRTQTVPSATLLPTLLTMRPKWGGPRHEPFFFNDFRRIRTVYPTTMATTSSGEATTESTTIVITTPKTTTESITTTEKVNEIFEETSEATYPFKIETTTDLAYFVPEVTNRAGFRRQTKRHFSWVNRYKNHSVFDSNESYMTTEPPVHVQDREKEEEKEFYKEEMTSTQRQHSSTKQTTTDNYHKVSKESLTSTGKPHHVELNVGNKVFTVRPVFFRPLRTNPPTISTTLPPTTFKSHIHAIKHKVKSGFKKFFSFFGFGKSEKDDKEE